MNFFMLLYHHGCYALSSDNVKLSFLPSVLDPASPLNTVFLHLGHLAVLGLKTINKYFKRQDGLEIGILEQIHMKWLPSQSCNLKCYARLKFMNSKLTLSSSILLGLPMLQVNLYLWHNSSKQLGPGPRPDISSQSMYLLKIGYWETITK